MSEPDDIALLKQYAESHSESAFAALVERHVNLVYSVALRSVGNAHAAEEIAQAVFIILARKAKSLGDQTVVSGWLYQTARLTAANFVRGEIRRQNREQEAYMQSILNEPESETWRQIAPLLDDAMGRLGEKDRNAVVLRFFENKNLDEVGAALGASEDAAKMRVNRALEKLRKIFPNVAWLQQPRLLPERFRQIRFRPRRWVWRKQFPPLRLPKARRRAVQHWLW